MKKKALQLGLMTALLANSALTTVPVAAQSAPPAATPPASQGCSVSETPFTGVIGTTKADSREDWPNPVQAPKNAPNILIWLMDDVGFGLISAFGGMVETPNIERVAAMGLKYTNFHSTPLCSPSRASILTGRNPHSVHMGAHANTPMGFPGYDAFMPRSAATTAKVLRERGYSTVALGKWDHMPIQYLTPTGPFDYWPSGQGFDRSYNFLAFESDHFRPTMWQGNELVTAPLGQDYYLTTDLADRAIAYANQQHSVANGRPFYMYWATGAVHSPHQATKPWLDRYKGRFDQGWDVYREKTLVQQKKLGVIPANTKLAPRPNGLSAWSSLTADQKRLYARQMEAIAAQLSEADHEFGRILDALKASGQLDNTIVVVTADNGASAEGGPDGTFNMTANSSGVVATMADNLKHIDDWGGPDVLGHYSAAWAVAANTPFRYYKQTAHDGGNHVPMVMSWPAGIRERGIRTQYAHIIDLAPTFLEAASITPPDCVDGVRQKPLDGIALNYSFDAPRAPSRRTTQYYELWGNRGLYHDGWKAEVLHKASAWNIMGTVPFAQDKWELYDVRKDPGETTDLAQSNPEKLKEMQALFDQEARKYGVYPIDDALARGYKVVQELHAGQDEFDYVLPGVVGLPDRAMPPLAGRSYVITAELDVGDRPEGVILAAGGVEAGFSLFVKEGRLHYALNDLDLARYAIADTQPLPKGRVKVSLTYEATGKGMATARLSVDGRDAGTAQVTMRNRGTYSGGGELFNIGTDMGSAPTRDYAPPYPFTGGTIRQVTVKLKPTEAGAARFS